ncbi:MAG: hypothetical protein A2309_00520 [Bacteroidetes bacterium RIFOXYB2_FULL_35_7]|nr:MAG: hypothetical protein A2X01_13995 [Bacteroidetes bacterium GWF2_35_48]OFY95976.1 MAG: hypothetical protein A2309_00520 [Bacteroidetes bacterium RIFOXYB2_FULL_35_7]
MKLDRKNPPPYRQIEKINILQAKKEVLFNGIPVYTIHAGSQDIVKIDFLFHAGTWYQEKPLVALFTNMMLHNGSKNYSAHQIAETLDFYGAQMFVNADKHRAFLSLISLNRHLEKLLLLVEDILKTSLFSEKEFDILRNKEKQRFIIEQSKVSTLARTKFNEVLFGTDHPYGRFAAEQDYNNLKTEQLKAFFQRLYNGSNCEIIIAGRIKTNTLSLLDKYFGQNDWVKKQKLISAKNILKSDSEKKHIINKDGAVQSALRMGKIMVNKLHPDYLGLQVLNTVLGGYFGSRLMSNIREDKGYTYGIGSALMSLEKVGFFVIMSEVKAEVSKDTIKEIFFEFDKLRNELIPVEELNLVKNFMLGEMLSSIDGSFALAEAFKSIHFFGLGYDYFDTVVNEIKTITPEKLNSLANKYLQQDSMYQVVAGKY